MVMENRTGKGKRVSSVRIEESVGEQAPESKRLRKLDDCTCRECWHIGTCSEGIGGPVGLEIVGVVEGTHRGCVAGSVSDAGTNGGAEVQDMWPWVGIGLEVGGSVAETVGSVMESCTGKERGMASAGMEGCV